MTRSVTVIVGVLALALVLGAAAQAADLTLDNCIDLALKNRAAVIAARGSEDLAKAGKRAALGAFLPSISAAYQYDKSEFRNGTEKLVTDTGTFEWKDIESDLTTKTTSFGADLGFTLPDHVISYAKAKVDRDAARLDVIGSEQDMIYAVKSTFYLYLAAVQNVTVLDETVKRSEEQLKLIQSKFELGSAAKSDVLKQKVQYGNDRLSLLRASNAVTSAAASLAYTVGLDPRQEWSFSREYIVRQYDGSLDDAITFGLAHEPTLLASEKGLKSADYGFTLARTGYLPKLSPSASYGYGKDVRKSSGSQTNSGWTLGYGFTLSLNIFDGFAREKTVTAAKVARNNARARLADARNLIANDIKTAFLDIERLKEQKRVSDENVAAATEDLKITQEKYNLGAATILDLLVAQVSLKEAQVSSISADFNLNVAVAKLENAMGKM